MSNQIKVHTDANYRIRDGMGSVMQSARFFNNNNCIQNKSLRRNILSNHFVQPYTQRFDDGSCDYNIARDSDLRANSLQYDFRPQNYEQQLYPGNNTEWTSEKNSKMNQAYNIGDFTNEQPNFNESAKYYPGAYGNLENGDIGHGSLGNFEAIVPPNNQSQYAEQFMSSKYRNAYSTQTAVPQTLLAGNPFPPGENNNSPRNFGAIPPNNTQVPHPAPTHYQNFGDTPLVSYMQPNLQRVQERTNYPRSGVRSQYEQFTQPQPRGGRIGQQPNFFFEQPENFINVNYNTPGYAKYVKRGGTNKAGSGTWGRGEGNQSLAFNQLNNENMEDLIKGMEEQLEWMQSQSNTLTNKLSALNNTLQSQQAKGNVNQNLVQEIQMNQNKLEEMSKSISQLEQNIKFFQGTDPNKMEGIGQAAGMGTMGPMDQGARARETQAPQGAPQGAPQVGQVAQGGQGAPQVAQGAPQVAQAQGQVAQVQSPIQG